MKHHVFQHKPEDPSKFIADFADLPFSYRGVHESSSIHRIADMFNHRAGDIIFIVPEHGDDEPRFFRIKARNGTYAEIATRTT